MVALGLIGRHKKLRTFPEGREERVCAACVAVWRLASVVDCVFVRKRRSCKNMALRIG